jgi:RNA polymerase sigma-70 factor (ECF subfamily)
LSNSDQQTVRWVVAARDGSTPALELLYRRYVGLVHGILLSRHRRAVAEELTQECFMTAFQRIRELRDPAKFVPWLATIARRARPQREHPHVDLSEETPADVADPAVSVEAINILNAIRHLPPAYRETLMLRLVEGMSGDEIAIATDMSADSVRVNLHRGMQKLREQLGVEIARGEVRSWP